MTAGSRWQHSLAAARVVLCPPRAPLLLRRFRHPLQAQARVRVGMRALALSREKIASPG